MVIRPEPRRRYPFGSLFTHTLGYTNEITGEELKRRRAEGYRPQDRVGAPAWSGSGRSTCVASAGSKSRWWIARTGPCRG